MGGSHAHPHAVETRRMRRVAWVVVTALALVTLGAMVWLWPGDDVPAPATPAAEEQNARVVALHPEPCPADVTPGVNGCGTATVELVEVGQTVVVDLPNGPGAPLIADGDEVVVIAIPGLDEEQYGIVDHQRSTGLWVLCLAFVVALLAFGRWRGLSALAGLGVTFVVLLFFVVPAILAGEPPLFVALAGSAAITLTVLYLTHGVTMTSTVAVIGTLASLALTGALAAVSVNALSLSGITDDISASVSDRYGITMSGLLVASIVIGSVGVLDDVTVTQANIVSELARANPSYGFGQLYSAASRVGRSHIASVVNTIVLAYAGASLPLLILVAADNPSFGDVLTTQFISQEIVRSIVATLGLIAAVPLTTVLAAYAARAAGAGRADKAGGAAAASGAEPSADPEVAGASTVSPDGVSEERGSRRARTPPRGG
ncbi:MAG TPA: YibE/F family protein [Ornithinibacter sp.]|nr:YibE/F family protein [Ornithinibacter sp.]